MAEVLLTNLKVYGTFIEFENKMTSPEKIEACNSVDLESVFPTHGVVGSNPTKPQKIVKKEG